VNSADALFFKNKILELYLDLCSLGEKFTLFEISQTDFTSTFKKVKVFFFSLRDFGAPIHNPPWNRHKKLILQNHFSDVVEYLLIHFAFSEKYATKNHFGENIY
jgi:hypothetical protein